MIVFLAAAAFHVIAAGVHVAALVRGEAAPLRHALFVAINLGVAYGFWRRPRWFPAAFALLVVQQLGSHGAAALRAWREQHRVDVASLLVIVWMPTALALLLQARGRDDR